MIFVDQTRPERTHRALALRVAIAVVAAVLISACDSNVADAPDETVRPTPIEPSERPKNFLFIILDAFHGEHASMLGYDRETTPHLDALARKGVYFTAAHSQSASTISSTLSFMTGQYLGSPEIWDGGYFVPDCTYTMAEAFSASGFRTGGFSANPWITERLQFDRGFDHFVHETPVDVKDTVNTYRRRRPESESRLVEEAKRWIGSTGESGWFCYLHLLRPHTPYEAPDEFQQRFVSDPDGDPSWREAVRRLLRARGNKATDADNEMLRDLYDGNIAYADSLVGELLTWLDSIEERSDTLIVIASDHGEAFMQHGVIGHNSTVYEEMTHVPMVFAAPEALGLVSRAVDAPVEMIDLFPTLVDVYGLEATGPLHGKSLLGLLKGSESTHKETSFSQTENIDHLSVRLGDLKLITERRSQRGYAPIELYDLGADPGETKNLLPGNPNLSGHVAALDSYLQRAFLCGDGTPAGKAADESAPELSIEEIDTLKSLGYLE